MTDSPVAPRAHRFGLPVLAIYALGALAAARGVLHDLGIIQEGEPLNLVLVVVPLVVWIVVAAVFSTRPFVSLLAAGVVYGVLLALTHIVLWDANITISGVEPPALGGSLEGVLPGWIEAVLLRGAAALSSIVVGVVVGAATGLVAWGARSVARRLRGLGAN